MVSRVPYCQRVALVMFWNHWASGGFFNAVLVSGAISEPQIPGGAA